MVCSPASDRHPPVSRPSPGKEAVRSNAPLELITGCCPAQGSACGNRLAGQQLDESGICQPARRCRCVMVSSAGNIEQSQRGWASTRPRKTSWTGARGGLLKVGPSDRQHGARSAPLTKIRVNHVKSGVRACARIHRLNIQEMAKVLRGSSTRSLSISSDRGQCRPLNLPFSISWKWIDLTPRPCWLQIT